MKTIQLTHTPQLTPPRADVYAALDLHSGHSVLGSMDHDGAWRGWMRFATDADGLCEAVRALGGGCVWLTLEASSLTRWALALVRPLVARVVVCEPRHNRLMVSDRLFAI